MFSKSTELKLLAETNVIEKKAGFGDIVFCIDEYMTKEADKGNFGCCVEINSLVQNYMDLSTSFEEVTDKIKLMLEDNGFKVEKYSNYKEESLRIKW